MSVIVNTIKFSSPVTSGRRILVTGGAGFLGSHLCERLLQRGPDVICLDNFSTGRMAECRSSPELRTLSASSARRHRAARSARSTKSTISPARPRRRHYQADPIHTMKTSVLGALNLLELASAAGMRGSSRLRPRRSTAIRMSIRSPRATGATSIRSARAPATTKASAAPRRCSSTIHEQPRRRDQGRAHLQHLRPAHAARRRPRRFELHRPGAARATTSPSMATARRPARSAMSTT